MKRRTLGSRKSTGLMIGIAVLEFVIFALLILLSQKYRDYIRLSYSVKHSFFQNNPVALLVLIVAFGIIGAGILVFLLKYMIDQQNLLTNAAIDIRTFMDGIHAALVNYTTEENGRIVFASRGFYELFFVDREKFRNGEQRQLLPFICEEYRSLFSDMERLAENGYIEEEIQAVRADGQKHDFLVTITAAKKAGGHAELSAVFVDISEQKRMREELALEQERFRMVSEISRDIIMEYEYDTDTAFFSEQYRSFYRKEPVLTSFLRKLREGETQVVPEDIPLIEELFCAGEVGTTRETQFRMRNQEGEPCWCHLVARIVPEQDGKTKRLYGKLTDINSMKQEIAELEARAKQDALTGVLNRSELRRKMEQELQQAPEKNHAFVMIDVDNFKGINDMYGHLNGDKILLHVVNCLKECMQEGEYLGRFGGDEFALFLTGVQTREAVLKRLNVFYTALQRAYTDGSNTIPFSVSLGAACTDGRAVSLPELMERADEALYEVKGKGKNAFCLH